MPDAIGSIVGTYMRTAVRTMIKEKSYSLINGDVDLAAVTSNQLAPLLQEQYPEVELAGRFQPMPSPRYLLRDASNQGYYWENLFSADNAVLENLSHEVIHGDPETALIDPTSMAVSESFARRYFGDRNPIGENIYTDISTYRIDLVFADLPDKSHLKYDALMSYNRIAQLDGGQGARGSIELHQLATAASWATSWVARNPNPAAAATGYGRCAERRKSRNSCCIS